MAGTQSQRSKRYGETDVIQHKSKHHMNDHKSTEIRAPNMKSSMNIEKGTHVVYFLQTTLKQKSLTA
jgi:hypothetical protein